MKDETSKLVLSSEQFADTINIVLLRTTHPGNVGAVARAMKNMGLKRLQLVAPEFNKLVPEDEAYARAAGAEDILSSARTCATIDEAIADCQLVIGASARSRKLPWPLMNPRDCAEFIIEKASQPQTAKPSVQVAILFGQEASGLSNDELYRCHYHVNIPASPTYSSLNLAMAVQVICYELRMAFLALAPEEAKHLMAPVLNPMSTGWDEALANVAEVEGFLSHLEQTLIRTEFHDPNKPRQLMARLRRLFQRAHLDQMEVNILRGILSSIDKYIQQKP